MENVSPSDFGIRFRFSTLSLFLYQTVTSWYRHKFEGRGRRGRRGRGRERGY
jgi:hypothetical protein